MKNWQKHWQRVRSWLLALVLSQLRFLKTSLVSFLAYRVPHIPAVFRAQPFTSIWLRSAKYGHRAQANRKNVQWRWAFTRVCFKTNEMCWEYFTMLVEQILVDNYFCSEQKFLVISKSQEKEHRGRVQVYTHNYNVYYIYIHIHTIIYIYIYIYILYIHTLS